MGEFIIGGSTVDTQKNKLITERFSLLGEFIIGGTTVSVDTFKWKHIIYILIGVSPEYFDVYIAAVWKEAKEIHTNIHNIFLKESKFHASFQELTCGKDVY